jgi:hypothetical protein
MPFSLQTSITPGRSIVFLICLSLTVMLSTSSSKTDVEPLILQGARFLPRQNSPSSQILSSVQLPSTPTSTSTSRETPTSQSTNTPNETPTTTSTTSEPSTTQRQDTSTTPPPQSQTAPPSIHVSSIQSTGSDGLPTVVVVTVVASSASSSSSPTPTSDGQANDDSSGLGTGSIIGLSVAGGIALLGIVAFFIWKFTRKRGLATYDDGEIKWPDLNSENHGPGQDDLAGPQRLSDGASIRDPSFRGAYGDGGLTSSQSQVDLHYPDPYSVPPLPHLDPNQPYHDDPNAGAYRDNFAAPVFTDSRPSSPNIRGEAIPMNQINRSRSPGPQNALHTGYGGRQSPGPQDAYGGGVGRQSPGPQDAYGGGYGRRSPGPNDAYGAR